MLLLLACISSGNIGYASDNDPAGAMSAYDAIRVGLVGDHLTEASDAARHFVLVAPNPALAAASVHVAEATDLASMRAAYSELSREFVLDLAKAPPKGLHVYRCSMAPNYPYWLQEKAGLQNPYMGASMPGCGEGTTLAAAAKAAVKTTPTPPVP